MVAPGVPSELRDETMVLMPVVFVVGRAGSGVKLDLRSSKVSLMSSPWNGKNPSRNPRSYERFRSWCWWGRQKDLRRASRFLNPHRVLAGEHHPFHFEVRGGP